MSNGNGSKKKRAASPDASPAPTQDATQSKKPKIAETAKVGDGQNAKSNTIAISIDEYCPLGNYRVYVDIDGTIWDASLNQTNASANNNKFYKVQVCFPIPFWTQIPQRIGRASRRPLGHAGGLNVVAISVHLCDGHGLLQQLRASWTDC